jgi:hypothetical protein
MAYQDIDGTGVILADTSDILAEVELEWQEALGADLVLTSDTPQGVLIAQETQARAAVMNNNAAVANQINPNMAGGVFLDAILAFMGLERQPATFTYVQAVTLTGVAGTPIPAGTQASTAAGDIFASVGNVTIPSGGSVTVDFQALVAGPVPCAIGALTKIEPATAVFGWETVTNANAGVLGQLEWSDAQARQARITALAIQGRGTITAIESALAAVVGVTSFKVLENYYGVPMGMLIGVSAGATLSGTTWSLSTTGDITVDVTSLAYIASLQTVPAPAINPWPTAKYTTTGNITLSGLGTQTGGDWAAGMTDGDIVLAKNQTTASQNGLWVVHSGAWTRHAYMPSAAVIKGSNGGIALIRNSVWACVAGGTNLDVATALLESKSGGAGWNGGQSQAVVESSSGQTYTVLFDRPTEVQIGVVATLSQGTNTSNLQVTALQAMIDFATGQISGEPGWIVGVNASPFDLAGAITTEQPGVRVREIQIASIPPNVDQTTEISIAPNQQAVLNTGYVTITVIA